MHSGAQRIEATLAQWVEEGTDAGTIADSACTVWRAIATALTPIIGQRGLDALYKRSLHVAQTQHPGLAFGDYDEAMGADDFHPLHVALSGQTAANAALATRELLRVFHELLASLIGESLTERLLRSALGGSSNEQASRGTTP